MPTQPSRGVRLFVDSDGRLTELLNRLNLKTSKVSGIDSGTGHQDDFKFVELSERDTSPDELSGKKRKREYMPGFSKGRFSGALRGDPAYRYDRAAKQTLTQKDRLEISSELF